MNQMTTNRMPLPDAILSVPKLRAVVVDDIPELLECVSECVQRTGVIDIVGTACNGLEGLRIATALKPDLVLMDVNMPVMDGLKSAQAIKSIVPGIQVVLMSADNSCGMRDLAMRTGADEFISKMELVTATSLLLQVVGA